MNTTDQTPEKKPENIGKIKTIIITIVMLLIVVLGSIIGLKIYNQKKTLDRETKDRAIVQVLFDLRSQATAHYDKNKSYKDWLPSQADMTTAQNLDTTLVFRKSDYQTYVLYAYEPGRSKYFCIDTTGFADEVAQIKDKQIKCN